MKKGSKTITICLIAATCLNSDILYQFFCLKKYRLKIYNDSRWSVPMKVCTMYIGSSRVPLYLPM